MRTHTILAIHPGWFFMAGCLLVQQHRALPGFVELLVPLALALVVATLSPAARCSGLAWMLLSFGLGYGWAGSQAQSALDQRLPLALEAERLTVTGFIDGLIRFEDHPASASFPFRVMACADSGLWCPVGSRILVKLNAGKPEGSQALSPLSAIRSGSVWQIDLRLSALHGQRNPAGTDLERLALQSDWVARGRAPLSHSRQLEALAMHPLAWVHRTRQVVRDAIRRASAEPGSMPRAMAVIEALVIGSGEGLDPEQWDAFNRTGVGHLLSISGSHVTMFAGFAAFFGVTLLQRTGSFGLLGLRWHTMQLPRVCFAAFGAIAYTLLAGFGLPAQRTCAMVLVTGVMSLSGRRHAPQAVLSCAAVMVCLIDPWAVISPGFWLSFAAVAALVISGQAMQRPEKRDEKDPMISGYRLGPMFREAFQGQWAASVVMIPLSVLFFSQISWIAPLANALAIPWITFVITPLSLLLALLASLRAEWVEVPMRWLALITEQSLQGLDAVARWDWISSHSAMPPGLVIVVAVLSCWLLIWPLAPWPRWTASLLMLPLMFWPVDRPREGELRVLFFDVGQGSAVFVQSQEFSLLYDSGPAFSLDARADGRNAGFQLVLPTLRSRGIASIDWLVLSHADLDHTGGALSLYRHLRIGQVLSGSPAAEPSLRDLPVVPCSRATELRVRNSSLRFLHPEITEAGASTSGSEDWGRLTRSAKSRSANRNAQSCVLLIEHRGRRLLLPGDLPSLQETAVLLREPAQAGSALDVLLLGHHGASNSSAAPWLDYWRPQLAVVQAGYRNRYGHPHDATLARLCERSIPLRRTDLEGAIELTIGSDGLMHWKFERERTQRYWTRLLAPAVSCPAENGPEGLGTKSHH